MSNTAYIVAGFRSAVGKAKKGGFRFYRPDDIGASVIKHLVKSIPNLDKERIDDVIVGNATPEAEQGLNMGRMLSLMGLDTDKVPGMTVNRDLGLIGGRKWAIKASPARSYILEKRSSNPAIIFILVLTFLTSSIIYIYRLQKQSEITEKAVESRTIELKEAKKALERITLLDEMTGVANRRHFDNYFMQEWKRGLREHPPPDNYCYRYRLFQTIQ